MNTLKAQQPPLPSPEEEEEQKDPAEPGPEQKPRRRRIMQPVFEIAHSTALGLSLLLAGGNMMAQTTPIGTTQQDGSPGWTRFDDRVAAELDLTEEQQAQLGQVDARYEMQYQAYTVDPKRGSLKEINDQRNKEIEAILKPEQYDRWITLYHSGPRSEKDIDGVAPEIRK
jgi:hypothetical protein